MTNRNESDQQFQLLDNQIQVESEPQVDSPSKSNFEEEKMSVKSHKTHRTEETV